MTAQKQPEASPSRQSAASGAQAGGRKPWIKKSPIDVMLDQIGKQEAKVKEMEKALNSEKQALQKLLEAKKVLQS